MEISGMKKHDFIGGFIWILIAIGLCIGSIKLDLGSPQKPGPGFIPFIAGGVLALFGAILVFSSILKKVVGEENLEVEQLWVKGHWRNILVTLLALFVYALLFDILGFYLTTFMFLFFLFKLTDPQRWLMPLFFAGISVILSYLVFTVWLMGQLPRGVFI